VAAALALCGTGLALALSGHASSAPPQWLMRPAVFVHAVAIAVWIGALAPLGLALRAGGAGGREALQRFSRTIPAVVAALVLAGIVLSAVQVGTPSALVDTAYGRIFLIKLVLLFGLFLLVAVNRWTLTEPALAREPSASRRLVRSIGVETALAIAIFGVAAAWRFTPPPRSIAVEAMMPAMVQLQSDKTIAVVWAGPARVGPVDLVVNVLTRDFEPFEPKEVSLTLSNPSAGIEPFSRRLERGDGMSDWHARQVIVPIGGQWHVRVNVLIGDFEMDPLEGIIPIRP
jgi:copper transport protein